MTIASGQMIRRFCSKCRNKDNSGWKENPEFWKCDWNFGYCQFELPKLLDRNRRICKGFEEMPPAPPTWWRVWLNRIVNNLKGKENADNTTGKTS